MPAETGSPGVWCCTCERVPHEALQGATCWIYIPTQVYQKTGIYRPVKSKKIQIIIISVATCCSQCEFTTNFESALIMHRQLHHEDPTREVFNPCEVKTSHSLPGTSTTTFIHAKPSKEIKLPGRTSSATRLFDKLRARIGRGRTLFSHPEEPAEDKDSCPCHYRLGNRRPLNIALCFQDMCMLSECTSKGFQEDLPLMATRSDFTGHERLQRETFRCHLCNFEADRITVLDRHLLNDHKIGIDNLLKLVMAKTKDALSEDNNTDPFIRQPYYKPQEMEYQLQEGEFMETVAPRVRVMKHAGTNTEDTGLTDNFKRITSELEKIVNCPPESHDQSDLFQKMQTLNEYMCKFVDSSNMLKKVLTKELDTKSRGDRNEHRAEPVFDLRLGE
ncbi:uncharacterized protein LOC134802646 [Cydia splendana]|uniref:uncharacterized protein LOC134802646 n=1 Tax=Cydia splendana TaxID=1100963 RepID=UPI00300BFDDD